MKLTLTESNQELEIDENTNLLALLESKGIVCESQCRSGFCGACRVKKISGNISYDKNIIAFMSEDEVLLCCAKVQSDLVIKK